MDFKTEEARRLSYIATLVYNKWVRANGCGELIPVDGGDDSITFDGGGDCRPEQLEPASLILGGPSSPKPLDLTTIPNPPTDLESTDIDENPPKRLRPSVIRTCVEAKNDAVAEVVDAQSVVDAESPPRENEPAETSMSDILSTKSKDESVQMTTIEIIDLTEEDDTNLEIENISIEPGVQFDNSPNQTVMELTAGDDTYLKTKIAGLKHPVSLPQDNQKVFPRGKPLLPAPILNVSLENSSVKFSWTMKTTPEMSDIKLFEVYYYEEFPSMESKIEPWKKMMDIPYNHPFSQCALNKLTENRSKSKFHLSVRAVDVLNRMGPFSEVKTIKFRNK